MRVYLAVFTTGGRHTNHARTEIIFVPVCERPSRGCQVGKHSYELRQRSLFC
jgi:hypothetical protein